MCNVSEEMLLWGLSSRHRGLRHRLFGMEGWTDEEMEENVVSTLF